MSTNVDGVAAADGDRAAAAARGQAPPAGGAVATGESR